MDDDGVSDPFPELPPLEAYEQGNILPFPRKADGGDATISVRRSGAPTIHIAGGTLHTMASDGEKALLKGNAPFYVRGEKIVRPVLDEMPASNGRRTKVARLAEVTGAVTIDYLSRTANFVKWNARKKGYVQCDPPSDVAAIILSRDGEWSFPRLAGVITTPTLRPDGTILSEPGYDPATQLLLLNPPKLPKMPPKPSRGAAIKALKILDGLLDEFPFVDEESRAVALSALITPVVRGAISVAPMHVTTAPVPGSGKSFLIDLVSAINSGERAPVMTAAAKDEETEKRLVAALVTGQTIISIDNINGALGGDFLCQVIERPVVSVRPLGASQIIKVESRATCFATGNNIQLVGDMTRRVIVCSLDPDMERPELRTFKHSPFDQILADRGLFVAAALIIVRAYVVAGCPNQLPALASFEDWSRLVRSALVWLGKKDPVETMNRARADDPTANMIKNVLVAWHNSVQSIAHTSGEICEQASQSIHGTFVHAALREALIEVAEDKRGGLNSKKLGHYLARYHNRVTAGLKLITVDEGNAGQKVWRVVKA